VSLRLRVEFFYDVVCPYAYLGFSTLSSLRAALGDDVAVELRPILLGGVFQALGAVPDPNVTFSEAKARHLTSDLARWSAHHGVPLVRPDAHPRRTVLAMRALLAASNDGADQGALLAASQALFAAYWVEGLDVAQAPVVEGVLSRAGLDGARAVAEAGEPRLKDSLRARSDAAAKAGVFGVPTYLLHAGGGRHPEPQPELFWGQDRVELLLWHVERLRREAA
jgi:2-hydroxychromene-2-carboxylate isomerase